MLTITRHWYRSSCSLFTILLLPLSWIFALVVAVRYFLYRVRLKKVIHFPVPIIIVGNITVGGTGKTPLVIGLANLLRAQGFHPGIVSRGIGGEKHFLPYWIDEGASPPCVGDEAILLARRSHCPVIICIDRVAAVKELLAKTACDVVITDDGLQHYRLGRDIEIAVIDGMRQLGNQCLLPAGPLREPVKRLRRVDFIIEQGEKVHGKLTMQLQGNHLVAVNDKQNRIPIENMRNKKVHVVVAIGNPQRFFSRVKKHGLQVIEHVFPDHYLYQANDFNFNDTLPIIMTEKDAVKCENFADERFWFLPVEVVIDDEFLPSLLARLAMIKKEKICV